MIGNFDRHRRHRQQRTSYAGNGYWGVHLEGMGDCGTTPCQPDQNHETVEYNVDRRLRPRRRDGRQGHEQLDHRASTRSASPRTAPPAGNKLFGVNINGGAFKITVAANEIANNDAGVEIEPDRCSTRTTRTRTTNQNTITQNSIHDDNRTSTTVPRGIDLSPFGKVNTARERNAQS